MASFPGSAAGWRGAALLRRRSLRTARVLTAVTGALVGLLAAAGLLLAWRDYGGRHQAMVDDTRLLARAAGADAVRFLGDRIEALTVIANSPAVQSGDRGAMQAYFRLLVDQPSYARLSWYDLTGTRQASNLPDPPTGPLVISGRTYFQAIVATAQPFVDAAVTSLQDSSPIIPIAVPTFDAAHHLSGALVNPLTLDVLEESLATFQRPDSKVLVIDRANQLIIDADPRTGFQPVASSSVVARARALESGSFADVTGPNGTPGRLLGFAPAPTGAWLVVVSRSADAAFAPARTAFVVELLALLAIVVVGIGGAFWLGRRLRREAAAEQRAQDSAVRLAAIVDSSDDAIIGLTTDGTIISWNASASRIFGLEAAEAFGTPLSSLVAPERAKEVATLLEDLQHGQSLQQYETVGLRSDGTPMDVSLTLSPIRTSAAVAGSAVIARDITPQKRVAVEREQLLQREHAARAEAEAANRAKDEFLSVLSHELRTPLTAIMAGAQLLQRRKGLEPAVVEMATAIERSSQVQTKLINDLLDISRVISGKLQLDLERLVLPDLVQAALAALRPEAVAKGVALEERLDAATGSVQGDATRLQQVLANLLGNALKFTPSGGSIVVSLERVGHEALLTVRDSGIGIDPAFLPHVFERFRQADASSRRAYGGLGLGLAIVRTLVELHGGRVEAASEGEVRGATLTVWLPLIDFETVGERENGTRRIPDGERIKQRLIGLRLLLVEDDAVTSAMFGQALAAEGATVVYAASSAEGLAALDQTLPDVVLCDIGMPDEDGYAFVRQLRSRSATAGGRVRALAVTAYASPEDRERALAAGFTRHLGKPVAVDTLIEAIGATLAETSAPAASEHRTQPVGQAAEPPVGRG